MIEAGLAPRTSELEQVEAWRLHRLLQLGLPLLLAERAARSSVDLHELDRLIESGCPPITALAILT